MCKTYDFFKMQLTVVSQRTLTFGTQPFLFDYLHHHHHEGFVSAVGRKRARNLEYSTAAAVVGVGEIVFLPFDTCKVRVG